MAEPIVDDKLEVEAAPSWLRTATAAFRYNNLIGSAISSETLYESLFPSDPTPVGDEEIIKSVRDAGLESQLGLFGHVKSRGELDAMVNQVRKEWQDKAVLEAGGVKSFTLNMLAGVVDLPSLIAGPATAEALAARGFGRLVQAAGSAVVTGTLQTGVQELGLQAIQETRQGLESVENIGGAVVGGIVLGPAIAKVFGRGTVNRVGDGLKREIVEMGDGTLAAKATKAEDDIIDASIAAKKEIDDAFIRQASPDVPDPIPMPTKAEPSAPKGELDVVGRPVSPSEWALIKDIAKEAGVDPHDILKSLPSTQPDLHHAKGSLAKAVQAVMRVGGGNPVIDLSLSLSKVAREVVANFANLKTMFDGQASPTQVMNMAGRVYGEVGTAKSEIINLHTEWYRDVAKGPVAELDRILSQLPYGGVGNTLRQEVGGQFSLGRFSELVAHAVVFGKEPHLHPLDSMREAIQHPAVQKAAQAYRRFDDWMFKESVRSGLMRNGYRVDNHLRHVYAHDRIVADEAKFIETERHHAQEVEWNKIVTTADKELGEALAELEQIRTSGLSAMLKAARDAQDTGGIEALTAFVKKEEIKARSAAMREALQMQKTVRMGKLTLDMYRRKEADRAKLVGYLQSDRIKKAPAGEADRVQAEIDGLDAKWQTWLDGKSDELDAKIETDMAEWVKDWIGRLGKASKNTIEKYAKKFDDSGVRASDDVLEAVDGVLKYREANARAAHEAATNAKFKEELGEWARQHAEGVFAAITRGQTGSGGNHGRLTGGNIRGGHQMRNVFTPSRELMVEGWLNPDLFLAMDKMARQDGIDAVIARKFRRELTPAEQRLAARNDPTAYWLDGDDKTSIPDLDMRGVRRRLEQEYQELRNAAKTPEERLRLTHQHIADLDNIDDMVSIARGTHATDTATGRLHRATAAVQSAQFMWYMGKNSITNVGDTMKLIMTHGLAEPLTYLGLRMREKLDDMAIIGDKGRAELKEYASAVSIGLEHVNMHRLVYSTDIADPFANTARSTRTEQFTAMMTRLGSKAFLINHLNDAMKTAAFGISQHRLAKLALGGLDPDKMDIGDKNWLDIIGVSGETLRDLAAHFKEAGVKYESGKPLRFDVRDMHPDLADRIAAALTKDASITVLAPDALSKPAFLRASPVLKLMTQFSTFAMESGMGTMNLLSQRYRSGEINAPTVGMMAMLGVAWLTQALSIYADGNPDKIRRFWDAHERNPGFVAYTVLDRSGLTGPFGYLSNLIEDTTTIGARSLIRAGFGDDLKDTYPFSKKKFGQHAGNAWQSFGGPLGRTIKDHGEIIGDIIGEFAGAKHGKIPLLQNDGHITQRTVDKVATYVPLVNAFYLRALFENYAVKPLREELPKR